jgi:hypothetical protein
MSLTRLVLLAAVVAAPVVHVGHDEPKGENKLIGTWKLVSGKYGREVQFPEGTTVKYGGKEVQFSEGTTILKHVTPSHFMSVTYDQYGRVTRGLGGRYTLNGEELAETPEYGLGEDFEVLKGGTYLFKCQIDGNKWHRSGKLSNGQTIEEVWERVEKK